MTPNYDSDRQLGTGEWADTDGNGRDGLILRGIGEVG